ncbi:benenodin family lasso peptide [Novosphingobium sp. PS1R-30]|uniref:Benenodin family lasso peptide n=1 Tax=Novosphingobium anseongense TaxID=3133436 RepID=A0ABU8S1J9_9SPHN
MEREHETADLIELGQASTETKGVQGILSDGIFDLIEVAGMTDD